MLDLLRYFNFCCFSEEKMLSRSRLRSYAPHVVKGKVILHALLTSILATHLVQRECFLFLSFVLCGTAAHSRDIWDFVRVIQ